MAFALPEEFQKYVSEKLSNISARSVGAVLELSAEGGTVPFIARYRKEKTGNLDEVQVRDVIHCFESWKEASARRVFILQEIEKQGNLTTELRRQIEGTFDLSTLEELYRPYKKKKKTKAKMAKEAGLEPLANWIWAIGHGEISDSTELAIKAKEFINPTAGFATYEEALRGAHHIIVERLANDPELRLVVRDEYFNRAKIHSSKTTKFKPHSKYETYGDYTEDVTKLFQSKASHRYLALRRGWQEGELKVNFTADEDKLMAVYTQKACTVSKSQANEFLVDCAKTALTVHTEPSVSNELHAKLKELADQHAIHVFAENVRRVLMASPFGPNIVLGIDPGIRTGCKVALVDQNGNFVSHTVLQLKGEKAEENAKTLFAEVTKQIKIMAVAVGNGTGGREAEAFIRKIFVELGIETPIVMVNEAGASVYSASDVAREEFPELDLTVRGAISIARRLQDPLAELVKIDPKSIGVGQYQHDVNQSHLKRSLHEVVESCVNQVGVDLNTASESLLQYVAGIGPATAKKIRDYRKEHGSFKDRSQLLKVSQFSSKTFEQAAGFLRIFGGETSLDKTGIHPERYAAVKDMLHEAGLTLSQALGEGAQKLLPLKTKWSQLIGEYTFEDIIEELKKPGRDPRDPYKVFKYREDIHEVKDLAEGMLCPGIVTNVTNFGAFVDIGVHQDGLVHISELTTKFVDDPKLVVSPGDQVQVKVLKVDKEKNQISLSMLTGTEKKQAKVRKSQGKGKLSGRREDSKDKGRGGKGQKGPMPDGRGPSKGGKPRRPQAQPFNNPFAALTGLKK